MQKLTSKQSEILILLYRFRFLNREHLQKLFNHKYRSRILAWLNELTEKKYIRKYYDKKFGSSSSVYSLDRAGRKYLKANPEVKTSCLDRVWREANLSAEFRNHCLFLADIYLSLLAETAKSKSKLFFYTKTDLYGTDHLISPSPDAHFVTEDNQGRIKRYFLDIFDENRPPTAFRLRVRKYFNYYDSDEWQDNTNKPFPEIILVCPNKRMKYHLYYYIQRKLEEESALVLYLTTRDSVLDSGISIETLEKVIEKD